MTTLLVVGSAHLDVLAQATQRDDVLDRIGEVRIEVGGTACNIAINLAQCGASVRFLTAMNESPFSRLIADYLRNQGIEVAIDAHQDLPTGGFSAHLNTAGELVSAVSQMPVEQVTFSEATLQDAFDGVRAVIIDCNLSHRGIDCLIEFAGRRSIPVYVAAVSEEKSLRIPPYAGRIAGVFLNQREFDFMCRQHFGRLVDEMEMAAYLKAFMLITNGEQGSTLVIPESRLHQIPAASIPADGNRLGMGDALAAGVVLLHEIHGMSLPEATLSALKLVNHVGRSLHCHYGALGGVEQAIALVQHMAGHDVLTGVLNRRSTEDVLDHQQERRSKQVTDFVSLLMIDIDNFKSVNDTFGHVVGDEVIRRVAETIQGCVRAGDYVGRWGGEEFVAILPGLNSSGAAIVAERIRLAISQGISQPRQITVSIGVATSEPLDEMELVAVADRALYKAKAEGRNRVAVVA